MYTDLIIKNNIIFIKQQINDIAHRYRRNPKQISFIAVSKNQSINTINNAISAGQKHFGENYIQEGVKKILWCNKHILHQKLIWHFIGSIQSNKVKFIAQYFDWCHTLHTARIASYLNKHRPEILTPLNILIQINISHSNNKSGILPNQLLNLVEQIIIYPKLKLRGLMAIPEIENNYKQQLKIFTKMFKLFQQLKNNHPTVDTLSIGMSNDMEAAIAAGGNLLRIGTAIFGNRLKN
ncbi:YggS family pyridoxal phosphate-dependent enzyme [Blochmannia endosymbiont of Camponotus (Colobopsis) obliquus]|uniref:YggS family pyridoxal phosphate-dependent enzyme n=1 Tax=Blochmannia endosymbiont of Camponotus (Colobopsis) obliquus TaxID=1505597 RepID=UPI00061A6FAE|nr:YggS family pyridoxal phosphate-dependent enzyme [Blochmannia endosymbiont of Camponotus (Colobopsis) obliquus]AKC60413.1 UPF0001 protein YggS [Blochmannia endosymbiont of Camponotus (Colobopsis) obliquus]